MNTLYISFIGSKCYPQLELPPLGHCADKIGFDCRPGRVTFRDRNDNTRTAATYIVISQSPISRARVRVSSEKKVLALGVCGTGVFAFCFAGSSFSPASFLLICMTIETCQCHHTTSSADRHHTTQCVPVAQYTSV
jgi:hypothetical protein